MSNKGEAGRKQNIEADRVAGKLDGGGLGTKRICPNCTTKFYDFGKSSACCPKCQTIIDVLAVATKPSAFRGKASESYSAPAGELEPSQDSSVNVDAEVDENTTEINVEDAEEGGQEDE